jgi:hypothetical protein
MLCLALLAHRLFRGNGNLPLWLDKNKNGLEARRLFYRAAGFP